MVKLGNAFILFKNIKGVISHSNAKLTASCPVSMQIRHIEHRSESACFSKSGPSSAIKANLQKRKKIYNLQLKTLKTYVYNEERITPKFLSINS